MKSPSRNPLSDPNPNPFVEAALDIITSLFQADTTPTLEEVVSRLAEAEPLLSRHNLECIARTALFLPPQSPEPSAGSPGLRALPGRVPSDEEEKEIEEPTRGVRRPRRRNRGVVPRPEAAAHHIEE